jgi:hypothetical protein
MSDARPLEDISAKDGGSALTSPALIRFSLRTAFLLITVVAVALGIGGAYVSRKRAEARVMQHRNDLKQLYIG